MTVKLFAELAAALPGALVLLAMGAVMAGHRALERGIDLLWPA